MNRQIFTSNLIKAFEKYPNGKLVNYTDYQGQVRQGLMVPKRLMHPEHLERVAQSKANQVQMHQLWQWHLAAKALGRPEAYLNRITEVAKEVVKGNSL